MYGSARVRLLDAAVRAAGWFSRAAACLVRAGARQSRCRPDDLYAAARTARFSAAHHVIEQAADAAEDGDDVTLVAARTWPWFGAAFVYQEDDR